MNISLDAILYSGTAQPNTVSIDVLKFFSDKTEAEAEAYIQICRQIETLHPNENNQ